MSLKKSSKAHSKGIEYFNIPASFDTETSSFTCNGEKQALMYLWGFEINKIVFYGRTWEQFSECVKMLSDNLGLNVESRRLIVYVHNLAFDFQFIRSHLKIKKVFALKERKPVYVICECGIEFRCSYILTNVPLSSLQPKSGIKKLVGDIDYDLIRTPETKLTDEELEYFFHDLHVVHDYIADCIADEKNNINNIPLTKTGYVRRDAKKHTIGAKAKRITNNRKIISNLKLDADSYNMVHSAFTGGFTHANVIHVGEIINDVKSYDFTSSYPAVIVREKFPMSSPTLVEIQSNEQFRKMLNVYCCVFEITFHNLRTKHNDSPLSFSKCRCVGNYQINNGRVASADVCYTIITEQDFFTIEEFYDFDSADIGKFYRMFKDYLPTDFVEVVLQWYNDKTKLKGISGEEERYALAKANLNSLYGMMVTDIYRPDYVYSSIDGWEKPKLPDLEKAMQDYNDSKSRFLFYAWGVWVTAHARRALFQAIYQCDSDYIYSDTDSIKICNYKKHEDYFQQWNEWNEKQIEQVLQFRGIDDSLFRPTNLKGNKKVLGNWEDEGNYQQFKTLGAKRYAFIKNDKFGLVVSGLSPKLGADYLSTIYGTAERAIEHFEDGLFVPADYTGKKTHTYIDDKIEGVVKDYRGNYYRYCENTSINLSPCEFDMSLSASFKDYIKSMRGEFINDERVIYKKT